MKQLLIVEDDGFLNRMLTYNLTADGYSVTSAANFRTAAEIVRQREFDLVLLDVNLPDGSGLDLCRLIKPRSPDTIVIFLTANDQESDQIRGYEAGAVDYITKPFATICRRGLAAKDKGHAFHAGASQTGKGYLRRRTAVSGFLAAVRVAERCAAGAVGDGIQNAESVPQKSQTGAYTQTAIRKAVGC